ncbi:MAG: NAD+ synthase [Magnetovibrio sp.]|nr:NAD+ synthase [Magnetovibrio sp.]
MSNHLVITLAQINPTVGDISANTNLLKNALKEGEKSGADLVIAGELSISGYPPEDLVLKPYFIDRIESAVNELAHLTKNSTTGLLFGTPWRIEKKLYNAALLLEKGKIVAVRLKHNLPNYGVFDEARVFSASRVPGPIKFRNVLIGVMICEDMWYPEVAECLKETGAELFVVLNGSPFESDKTNFRLNQAVARITETQLPLIYVNLVGGQDELVFDGGSFVIGADYKLCVRLPFFAESIIATCWKRTPSQWDCTKQAITNEPTEIENIYSAILLGLKDYVKKNRFPSVVLGLSGGIDSALSATVAVDALGSDKVHAIMMPSPYTSQESIRDASEMASSLGIRLDEVSIESVMEVFEKLLEPLFDNRKPDATEENIQARIRGLLLMAMSNKLGHMLLTTGNKSEISVGFSTLYGDTCGGFSVLKDVYKTTVYELCSWRNKNKPLNSLGPNCAVFSENIIRKPPSAELAPNQRDQDVLPPYSILDKILYLIIEKESSLSDIVKSGYDKNTIRRVWKMLDQAEYKRRQTPPGVKISGCAFGRDRRYPITNGFKDQV